MTRWHVIRLLEARISLAGGQNKLARELKMDKAWMSRVVRGKIPIPSKILKELGLKRAEETYTEEPG